MSFEEIIAIVKKETGEDTVLKAEPEAVQPVLTIATHKIDEVCTLLRDHPQLYFDYLSCLTGIDNGTTANTMEVIYHLNSIPFQRQIVVKVLLNREKPEVPTVSKVWQSANWHEREAYDMFGIVFLNHPDLRRILMPADWVGYPLRKDYQPQETYHEIKVKY